MIFAGESVIGFIMSGNVSTMQSLVVVTNDSYRPIKVLYSHFTKVIGE